MRSIEYKGSLKRDIDLTRSNFDYWKNVKKGIKKGVLSTLGVSFMFGLISGNIFSAYLLLAGLTFGNVGINMFRSNRKKKIFDKEKKSAYNRILDFTSSIEEDKVVTPRCLKNASISQDYISFKNKDNYEEKEEIRSYYIRGVSGEILMLAEMRNELASLIDKKKINASLEITDGNSYLETDSSYGLYVMDGSEYGDVETRKTMALTIR